MGFITAGAEYNGNETKGIILRPAIESKLPMGMKPIFTDGAGSTKQTFFSGNGMNVVSYSDGWQGGNASGKKQKTFSLAEFKAEQSWSKQDYLSLIQRQTEDIMGAFQNDIAPSELKSKLTSMLPQDLQGNTADLTVKELSVFVAEWQIQQQGLAEGIFNIFWLADTDKLVENSEGSGTFPNGTSYTVNDADIRLNAIDGIWKQLMDDASTSPTDDQVKRIVASNGAVAQVETLTLTGTSGKADISCKGVTKEAEFDTDLTTTASNFVTANATAYADADITLTSSGAGLIFTEAKAGVEFEAPSIANVSGDLSGSVAHTTANTLAADLGTDEALGYFNSMVKGQNKVLKSISNSKKVIYATQSMIENYKQSLGTAGASLGTSESQRDAMINGLSELKFNGIRIELMDIDSAIDTYFGYYAPHRAILTIPDNIRPVLSSAGDFGESMLWFEKKDNLNMTRTQFELGSAYWLPEYTVVTY